MKMTQTRAGTHTGRHGSPAVAWKRHSMERRVTGWHHIPHGWKDAEPSGQSLLPPLVPEARVRGALREGGRQSVRLTL